MIEFLKKLRTQFGLLLNRLGGVVRLLDQLLPEVSYQNSRVKRNWKIAVAIVGNQRQYIVFNHLDGASWLNVGSFSTLNDARKFIKDNYEFPEYH
jgi:hypothetical protein